MFISFLSSEWEVVFCRSSLLLWLEHTFPTLHLDLDRCPLKSKYLTNTILYIADIREVEVIGIIYRYDKTWRIHIDLRTVVDFWFMGFSISCRSMLVGDLFEEFIQHSCLHTLLSLFFDLLSMIEHEVYATIFYG